MSFVTLYLPNKKAFVRCTCWGQVLLPGLFHEAPRVTKWVKSGFLLHLWPPTLDFSSLVLGHGNLPSALYFKLRADGCRGQLPGNRNMTADIVSLPSFLSEF